MASRGVDGYSTDTFNSGKSTDALLAEMDLRWGWGKFRPAAMQRLCNNPKAFLAWLCWFSLLQGFVVNGINNVNTSTFERRFFLESKQSSLISSAYDLSAAIFVIPFSYYGAHSHQPRLLVFAAFIMSCGSVVMAIPQWTTEPYKLGNAIADKCDPSKDNATEYCELYSQEAYLSNYLYVFLLGQFLHGIGGTILYTLGIVFIDEHVATNDSPAYQGVMYAASTLGPALGYIVGGQLLTVYVDWGKVDLNTITIEPEDPRFVGAWWIGFISTGILLLTVFIGLLPYQKHLPHREASMQSRESQAHDNGSEHIVNRHDFGKTSKDIPISFKLLLTNPVSMLLTGAGITEGMITSGFATFIAKFIENQYGQPAGIAAMIGGGVAVPGAAGGQFFGGLFCKLFHLRVRGMLKLCLLLTTLSIGLSFSCLASCPTQDIAGVVVQYLDVKEDLSGKPDLINDCNHYCWCTAQSYEPVCGSDGIQYFSSCHAGCQHYTQIDGRKVYSDCSCLQGPAVSGWQYNDTVHLGASEGKCTSTCKNMYLFLPFFMLIIITTFMQSVPAMNVSIRCVADKQRAFALGVKWMFVRLLGTVPGPVIFGLLFDRTCLVWQDKCDEKGSCWIYDNHQLSFNLFLACIVLKSTSLVFYMAAYCLYRPPPSKSSTPAGGSSRIGTMGGTGARTGNWNTNQGDDSANGGDEKSNGVETLKSGEKSNHAEKSDKTHATSTKMQVTPHTTPISSDGGGEGQEMMPAAQPGGGAIMTASSSPSLSLTSLPLSPLAAEPPTSFHSHSQLTPEPRDHRHCTAFENPTFQG